MGLLGSKILFTGVLFTLIGLGLIGIDGREAKYVPISKVAILVGMSFGGMIAIFVGILLLIWGI